MAKKKQSMESSDSVTFLNPRTCGIYKNGGPRFKVDPVTGQRTAEVDDQLKEFVDAYLQGTSTPGQATVPVGRVWSRGVLVPTYFDDRYQLEIRDLLKHEDLESVTLGELVDKNVISVRGGHGSPSNDQ